MVNQTQKRRGGSLVEVMISVLLVGLVIAPAVTVFARVAANYNQQAELDRAHLLARSMMAEIMQSSFQDPDELLRSFGIESDESSTNRLDFDDVDDFSGLVEEPPTERNGQPVIDANGYRRTSAVKFARFQSEVIQDAITPTRMKKIVVAVETPSGQTVTQSALRTFAGVADSVPVTETIKLQQIDLKLDLGLKTESSTVDVLNKFPQKD